MVFLLPMRGCDRWWCRRVVLAAVRDPKELARILLHLRLPQANDEVEAIRGPPADLDPPPEVEPWDLPQDDPGLDEAAL